MKKLLCFALLCLAATMGMMVASCQKEDVVTPSVTDSTDTTPDVPEPTFTIIGHWGLDQAVQYVGENEIDITPFYGEGFQLTFSEDGTLLVSDSLNNETEMTWTLDGDQLGFIQAPGLDPVMYTVIELTADKLVLENGTGTDYVTVMTLHRMEK